MEQQMNPVIHSFVEAYRKKWEDYARIAESVRARVKTLLDAGGIMAIVTSRAKDPDRLAAKLRRMDGERKTPFATQEEIFESIHDLVGVRIALYFPADGARVRNLLRSHFNMRQDSKVFPPPVPGFEELVARGRTAHERKIYPGYNSRRFDGYHAVHHYMQQESSDNGKTPNPLIEVQVASVLMHAWSEVEHDLAYKKMTGDVSREEYECLDEINGLVIAGEIALDRLRRMSRQRTRIQQELDSPFALKNYLIQWLEEKSENLDLPVEDEDMANVKQLFEMYREADVLSPVELELRLRRLGKDIPVSITPLVRQLMDQFTDENRKKAKQVTVENIRQYLEADETFYTSTRIGTYLTKWNILEDTIRKAVRTLGYKCANSAMSWKLVVEEKVLPPDITQTYYELRLQRNIIVHTNRLPREEKFLQLLQEMDGLTEKIKKEYGVK